MPGPLSFFLVFPTAAAGNGRGRADTQQEQADIQKERVDLAARELAEVSEGLQAAANALRESI